MSSLYSGRKFLPKTNKKKYKNQLKKLKMLIKQQYQRKRKKTIGYIKARIKHTCINLPLQKSKISNPLSAAQ